MDNKKGMDNMEGMENTNRMDNTKVQTTQICRQYKGTYNVKDNTKV